MNLNYQQKWHHAYKVVEEELRADAKTLAELVSTNKTVVLPLHGGSAGGSTDKNVLIKELLSQFKD